MENKREPIEFDAFNGHLILYCKGHYKVREGEFFEGLKMIWAIRCGYDYDPKATAVLEYIANAMFNIISICEPERLNHLIHQIHREIVWNIGKPEGMSPIESIIWGYGSILSNLEIKKQDKETGKMRVIVKLPKPNKRVFNRILRGNGRYDDYDLIKNQKSKL